MDEFKTYDVLVETYTFLEKLDSEGKLGRCEDHMTSEGHCTACTVMQNLALAIMELEDGGMDE